ncbi:Patellin-3 [Glycine soja]|uniref:Patellin-3 n=1 Tax=Glycine soja TaxID=3848 RepID=A0A0B2SCF4_GLYSO|nr:Patellin-3 [Glycine soja]
MDFKVKDALSMLRNTVRWRKEFGIEGLIEEYLGNDWDKVVFSHGHDKEGHPVYYNVFDEFEDKELYNKTGISTIVQLNDLKNSPRLGKRELRMISLFFTQRTKRKFLFVGPSKSAHTRKVKPKSSKRKRKKTWNYSDDVDSNSVEKVVAMWERRLSLKLLLAALNGKDSAVAMCRFCRLMGTTTGELLLNRDSGQDYKRNAYMEPDLQCSNAIQSMEKRLRAACNASDAKIDNVAKVLHAILCQYEKSIQTPEKWQKLVVFLQQRPDTRPNQEMDK